MACRGSEGAGDWLFVRRLQWRLGVQVVAIDPSGAFRKALLMWFPRTAVSVDAFHLVKLGIDMLAEVRPRLTQQVHGRRGRSIDQSGPTGGCCCGPRTGSRTGHGTGSARSSRPTMPREIAGGFGGQKSISGRCSPPDPWPTLPPRKTEPCVEGRRTQRAASPAGANHTKHAAGRRAADLVLLLAHRGPLPHFSVVTPGERRYPGALCSSQGPAASRRYRPGQPSPPASGNPPLHSGLRPVPSGCERLRRYNRVQCAW
ncbi:transposase (plasmid) [Arthrobacter sp. G.S.26]|uniref:transposase n=1 Tax=Arthrobacter sp. G.S.26 TaxID=3433706 RepID=UPI003D779CDC